MSDKTNAIIGCVFAVLFSVVVSIFLFEMNPFLFGLNAGLSLMNVYRLVVDILD